MNQKRKIDPVDGTLIGVAEVSAKTGFTPHQLRSWRKPENYDKAVFEALRDPNSSTVWYRLVDVEDWLDAHGKTSFMRAIPAPNAFKSSRVGVDVQDYDTRRNLELLTGINAETVYAWREKIANTYGNDVFSDYVDKFAHPIYKVEYPDYSPVKYHITTMNRFTFPVWFVGAVKASRMLINDKQDLGFTEAEIDALPVGQYPPANEAKRV